MKLFHQHNFAFTRTRHWTSLFAEMNPNDAGSVELTKMVNINIKKTCMRVRNLLMILFL